MRPGVEIYSSAAAPPTGVPTDTSVAFIVAEAAQGPVDAPTRITSLEEYTATYGGRVPGTYGYDAVDAYFHEGGTAAYFLRLAQGAVAGSADAAAIAAEAVVTAASPGAYANALKLDVVPTPGAPRSSKKKNGNGEDPAAAAVRDAQPPAASSSAPPRSSLLTYPEEQATPPFMATVSRGSKVVAVSRPLTTFDELAQWLAGTGLLTIAGAQADTAVAAGSVTLTGGDDGAVPVVDPTALPDALALISKDLGPGQILAPGKTDYESQAALLAHCGANNAENNRVAFLDGAPDDDALAYLSAASYLRGADEDRYGTLLGPWAVIPGLAPGTTRTVPWSAIQAGLCARNDLAGNPNQAAAGSWGRSVYAIDLTRTFTPAECEALLYAGVNTARSIYGSIQAYAFRTLVDPAGPRSGWRELNHARLNMAIVAEAEAVGQDHVFAQLDGRGHEIAAFGGDLTGILVRYYDADALYGDDVTEAFVVNTGAAVNTPDKLADGILSAVLSVRMSPHAELVQIYIVKQPITVSLV